jgi:serine/threonine-protein kinase
LVERVVGKMGSSMLVKVRHVRHDGRFLLKYLTPKACSEPHAIDQFLQAARASMRLRSEHTAHTVDAGRLSGGLPCLVTESFHGSELREILRVRGAFGREAAVDLALQAAHSVSEAHRHGIAHGSLSPSALFLTSGPEGQPLLKVLDFGSAATLRRDPLSIRLRHWTQGTAVFSESIRLWDTVACTAPERLRGSSEATTAGDVWALGAILYEMLLGAPPFAALSTPALVAAIAADRPESARKLGQSLPHELERVVLRCLAKDPDARFQSVHELAVALRRFASPEVRPIVERIERIQDYDPEQPLRFVPSRGLPGAHPEHSTTLGTEQPPATRHSGRRRWGASLLFATVGALAGVLLGTFVGRVLTSHDRSSLPSLFVSSGQHR